jgi:hypothetical protein
MEAVEKSDGFGAVPLSADSLIQGINNLQSLNRYSCAPHAEHFCSTLFSAVPSIQGARCVIRRLTARKAA